MRMVVLDPSTAYSRRFLQWLERVERDWLLHHVTISRTVLEAYKEIGPSALYDFGPSPGLGLLVTVAHESPARCGANHGQC